MEHTLTISGIQLRLAELFHQFIHPFRHEQKAHLSQLKELEAELYSQHEILEKTSLLSVSDLKGTITYANDTFCEVSKYSREELIGKPHSIVRHPDTPSALFKEMWKTIGSGRVWQGEIKNRAKDGSTYWVYATISPVLGENGKPVKYISMRQDITARKLIELELEAAKCKTDTALFENVNYAKHIHSTFLTPQNVLQEAFPESLLIYKAQNIVSGDFYHVQKKDHHTTIVLGDSTGHGVSASYISIMVLNILKRVLKLSSYCPAQALEKLHQEVLYATSINMENHIIESADMAFCKIDHENMVMEYAMAKLRGLIIRNGEVIELSRDKYSIGEQAQRTIRLNRYTIDLKKGDTLYLYTDGIIDQLGGERCKKFGSKQLIEHLVNNQDAPMLAQKQFLCEQLSSWQRENEQTDDMSLIGVKIN